MDDASPPPRGRVLAFAYDGSLNGDWVAHYAVRFARNTPARTLRLVHVHAGSPEAHLGERIARIAEECKVLGVVLETELVRNPGGDVAASLLELVPLGTTLIAGIRPRPRNRAFLAGSLSARLFDAGRFPVIAVRVNHPGVLGQPGRVLLPIAAHPRAAANALPVLRLLGDDLHDVHVLFVREVSPVRSRILSRDRTESLLAQGRTLAASVEEALRAGLAPHRLGLDSGVVVSDDTQREILLSAGKHRSRLICLGASRRTLPRRLRHGGLIEAVLRDAPSDVAVYRSVD